MRSSRRRQPIAKGAARRKTARLRHLQDEAVRARAEEDRRAAERNRSAAERDRRAAERTRGLAEEARQSAESARRAAEIARKAADEIRQTLDSARRMAETLRRNAEEARKAAERIRRMEAAGLQGAIRDAAREQAEISTEMRLSAHSFGANPVVPGADEPRGPGPRVRRKRR